MTVTGKVKIKNIGSSIYANAKGVLISDVDLERLQDEWISVAEEFVGNVIKKFNTSLHSIYLRGSVVNGIAIKNISDIDFCVISFVPLNDDEKHQIQLIGNALNANARFITRFDIGFYSADQIVSIKEKILLKLRSICMYGETLATHIPDPYPGKDVCVTLFGLRQELEQTRKEIRAGIYDSQNISATCKWMAKRVLRGGLELVSKREDCYTRDLYPCWEKFSKYYPEYSSDMYRILELAIFPTTKREDLLCVLEMGDLVCVLTGKDTDFFK